MAQLEGFEPPTFRFVAERSIQLSYSCITIYIIRVFFEIFNSLENFYKKTRENCIKILQIAKFCVILYKYVINRGVAQLVARVVWDHEVAGSIPVTSTIIRRIRRNSSFFDVSIKCSYINTLDKFIKSFLTFLKLYKTL